MQVWGDVRNKIALHACGTFGSVPTTHVLIAGRLLTWVLSNAPEYQVSMRLI